MNLLTIVEFGEDVCGDTSAAMNCKQLLEQNEVEEDHWLVYVIIMLGLFVLFRSMGAFLLTQKAKTVF